MSSTVETATEIRPFHLEIPEEQIDDLRRRIAQTRWPSKELVEDRSQGVQLATLQELARYWTTDYDWRKAEARLNALPQFMTEIDGVDIHFIHVSSQHENALPLIMTHGWPGSVIELLEAVGPLTDPTAHGGRAEDAFDLVLPSLPGYGFSGEPTEVGWGPGPRRAGMGGADAPARLHPLRRPGRRRRCLHHRRDGPPGTRGAGRHPYQLAGDCVWAAETTPSDSEEESAALAALATFRASGFGYFLEQATRPQTIGYALLDSPVALAAWMLDHDTDSYYKISHAFVDGEPAGNLTQDHILDNITLYWLTGTGASAARVVLGERTSPSSRGGPSSTAGLAPGWLHDVPRRDLPGPAQLGRAGYPNLAYFNKAERGGHFAAWEEPELFSSEVRAAFGSLR